MAQQISFVLQGDKGNPVSSLGERIIGPFQTTFTANIPVSFNLTASMSTQAIIDFAYSVYIDCSLNTSVDPVIMTLNNGYKIVAKPNTQGWYNLVSQKPIIYTLQCNSATSVTLWLANYKVPAIIYPTV